MNRKYKVIIIGGGPAGSLTAINLARLMPGAAESVLLLEAKRFPRDKVCGGGIAGRVLQSLEDAGVDVGGVPGVPASGFAVFFKGRRHFSPFTGREGLVVRRSVLDDHLLGTARGLGVEVMTSARAAGASAGRDGVTVFDRTGERFEGQALVCADGANGPSRSWFGLPHGGTRNLLLQADIEVAAGGGPAGGELTIDFSPIRLGLAGYAWFFPSVDAQGDRVINAGITGGSFKRGEAGMMKGVFEEVLRLYHPEISATAGHLRYRPYPERCLAFRQPFSAPRVLFVGEQLGADPMTGEGLGVCADSARVAALEIRGAIESGDFSFGGYRRKMLGTGSFPLWVAGRAFAELRTPKRFAALLSLITEECTGDPESFLNLYSRAFSGTLPPRALFTRGMLAVLNAAVRKPARYCGFPRRTG